MDTHSVTTEPCIKYSNLCKIIESYPDEDRTASSDYSDNIECIFPQGSLTKRPYRVIVRNLLIEPDIKPIDGKVPDLSLTDCTLEFYDNRIVGGQWVVESKAKYPSLHFNCDKIKFEGNQFIDADLVLHGHAITLVRNTMVGENHPHQPPSLHFYEYFDNKGNSRSPNIKLANNTIDHLHVHTGGILNMEAKNNVRMLRFDGLVLQNLVCHIGPNLVLDYAEENLFALWALFIELHNRSIGKNDKAQQKIIQRELDRLDYHIFRTSTNEGNKQRANRFFRFVTYKFKLDLVDRHFWFKSIMWVAAFIVLMLPPTAAFFAIFGC